MSEGKELTPNLDILQEYIGDYWQKRIPDWDNILNQTISDYKINETIPIVLIRYGDLNNYSNEIITFAGYYKITWVLFQKIIGDHNSPVWEAKVFADLDRLFHFIRNFNPDKIILSAKDDKNAVKNHSIKNPIVIQLIKSLLKSYFDNHWSKKRKEYLQSEKIYELISDVFPKKKNIRLSFNEGLIHLARFLRNETYLKDGSKMDIYRFIDEFCTVLNIKSLPADIEDLKKYIKL